MLEKLLPSVLALLGVLLGALISAEVANRYNSQNRRTDLYEAVFKEKFNIAVKLTTEAEYLRRGLGDYKEHSDAEKPDFHECWLKIVRELEFHARLFRWVLGEEVEQCALALASACINSISESRPMPDKEVEGKVVV